MGLGNRRSREGNRDHRSVSNKMERSTGALRGIGALRASRALHRSAPPERSGGTRSIKKKGPRQGPVKLGYLLTRALGVTGPDNCQSRSGCATVRVRTNHSCQLGLGTNPGFGRGRNSVKNYGIIFFLSNNSNTSRCQGQRFFYYERVSITLQI